MKIKCIVKRPDEAVGHMTAISDTLENLQRTVEGYVETVTLAPGLVILCNEEGRLNDMPYNCEICGIIFFGPIVCIGAEDDELADVPIGMSEWQEMLA